LGLIWRFNLLLAALFVLGYGVAALVAHNVLRANARDEALRTARMLLEAANATGDYTSAQIRPLLENQLKYVFRPQVVPAFAAAEQFGALRGRHADLVYKEAALNPTNPRDRASDWEAGIIERFRSDPAMQEASGERDTPSGGTLWVARPIQVKSAACLECHSTADVAPATMVELYGNSAGFGWKMNEIVGAQLVSVPVAVPQAHASEAFRTLMLALAAVFVVLFALVGAMLHVLVLRPVTRMAHVANQVSLGNMDAGEFGPRSRDEIGVLAEALARMKTSLVQAMNMLEGR
jgi:protein-histidine pros-kinase